MTNYLAGAGPTMALGVLVAGFGLTVSASASFAGGNENAKILIHLTAPAAKVSCVSSVTCADVQTAGALFPALYFANVLLVDGDAVKGVGGMEFGIQYNEAPDAGVDVFGWVSCGALEYPGAGWPHSGSGNLVAWGTWPYGLCQHHEPGGPGTGVTAMAGYFYVAAYSPDVMSVIPRPVTGVLQIADCEDDPPTEYLLGGTGYVGPSRMGTANFAATGNVSGYNPCVAVVPVKSTTWSAIKGASGR